MWGATIRQTLRGPVVLQTEDRSQATGLMEIVKITHMIYAFIRFGDGSISTESDIATITRALGDDHARFWLDFDCCKEEELHLLKDVFAFHPLAIEDTIQHVERPKMDQYEREDHGGPYTYLVVHGPDLERYKETLRTKELDIFISPRYLLTIHEEKLKATESLVDRAKKDIGHFLDAGTDMMLYEALDRLTDAYDPILDFVQDRLDKLEDRAIRQPRPELLNKISREKRELMQLRRTIGPQREVLAQLTRGECPLIRESARVYLRDVSDHLNRVVESVELFRDLVTSARDIYLSSLSNNLNQIMKTLTAITVIVLPLNLVTGFFGMNLDIPGIHSHIAFWIAMGVMLSSTITLTVLLQRKHWL